VIRPERDMKRVRTWGESDNRKKNELLLRRGVKREG